MGRRRRGTIALGPMGAKAERRRCTECRCWYAVAASALQTQKVCGSACRLRLRNRTARIRRGHNVQESRVDERTRQRFSRALRRDASTKKEAESGPCHAPPSKRIPLKLRDEILKSWDQMAAVSRASLQAKIEAIVGVFAENLGNEVGAKRDCHAPT